MERLAMDTAKEFPIRVYENIGLLATAYLYKQIIRNNYETVSIYEKWNNTFVLSWKLNWKSLYLPIYSNYILK